MPIISNQLDHNDASRLEAGAIYPKISPVPQKPWWKELDALALFLFATIITFLHGPGIFRNFALIMIAAFVVVRAKTLGGVINRAFPAPPELWCYTIWVFWAFVTGIFVAASHAHYMQQLQIVVQMCIMVWLTYAIMRNLKTADMVFWAIFVGGLVNIFGVLSGEMTVAEMAEAGDRVSGFATNPNGLGFRMVWTTLFGFFFWYHPMKYEKLKKVIILSTIPIANLVMLLSGSRKSAVGMAIVIFLWALYALGRRNSMGEYLKKFAVIGIIFLILFLAFPLIVEQTPVGQRFSTIFETDSMYTQSRTEQLLEDQRGRYSFYIASFELFWENPIFGVGLNNYLYHVGRASHSDIAESLSTTGIVGFFLYQAFFFLIILRAFQLSRKIKDPQTKYKLKMVVVGMLALYFIGLGFQHTQSQSRMLIATAFSVYTWNVKRDYQEQAQAGRQ